MLILVTFLGLTTVSMQSSTNMGDLATIAPPPMGYTGNSEGALCPCSCDYYNRLKKWENVTVSRGEVEAAMVQIKEELTVNKSTLSMARRKKTSASDSRPSATGIGYVGAVLLGMVLTGVVAIDLSSIWNSFKVMKRNLCGP